ncbi:hypothetical protein KCP69_25930 [Salmonella enterica subsp. enterica]|nr:hypothetical protein KCP69_25930 [Salmonella enterica subsp. enterica]
MDAGLEEWGGFGAQSSCTDGRGLLSDDWGRLIMQCMVYRNKGSGLVAIRCCKAMCDGFLMVVDDGFDGGSPTLNVES